MIRTTILALAVSAGALTTVAVAGAGGGAGTPYCYGVSCPCGNDDPNAGCINSSGTGALLSASGTNSVAAADLDMHVTGLPINSVTILVIGDQQQNKPFKDGKLCIGGNTWRLFKHQNSGTAGAVDFLDVHGLFALNMPPVIFSAGDNWNFQSWYRDSPGNASGCGQKSNLSNAYEITFAP